MVFKTYLNAIFFDVEKIFSYQSVKFLFQQKSIVSHKLMQHSKNIAQYRKLHVKRQQWKLQTKNGEFNFTSHILFFVNNPLSFFSLATNLKIVCLKNHFLYYFVREVFLDSRVKRRIPRLN